MNIYSLTTSINQDYTNPGRHIAVETKFLAVATDIRGFSVRNLLHITLLERRILKNFENLFTPDVNIIPRYRFYQQVFKDLLFNSALSETPFALLCYARLFFVTKI